MTKCTTNYSELAWNNEMTLSQKRELMLEVRGLQGRMVVVLSRKRLAEKSLLAIALCSARWRDKCVKPRIERAVSGVSLAGIIVLCSSGETVN